MVISSSRPGTATYTPFPYLLNYLMKTRDIIRKASFKPGAGKGNSTLQLFL